MRYIQNSPGKSLVVVALGTLVIVIVIAFSTLGGSATHFTAQAFQSPIEGRHQHLGPTSRFTAQVFQSPIEAPTPTPSLMPTPLSPTSPSGPSLEKDGDALLDFFERELEFQMHLGVFTWSAAESEDYTAGGKLVLQLVRDNEKAYAILAILPSLRYPERLRIEWVDFSSKRLKQQFWAISNAAAQHPELRAVAIDGRNNQVEVLIVPSDAWRISAGVVEKASLPDDLATLVADPSVIVREGEIEEKPVAVRGGDGWGNTSSGSNCTLGFKIEYNNTYSMLTAGHCVSALGMSAGDDVYHNTTKIGTYSGVYRDGASSSSGTGIDAAILYMN